MEVRFGWRVVGDGFGDSLPCLASSYSFYSLHSLYFFSFFFACRPFAVAL